MARKRKVEGASTPRAKRSISAWKLPSVPAKVSGRLSKLERTRLEKIREGVSLLDIAKKEKEAKRYSDMRYAIGQAGIQFAQARNVARTNAVLRMLKGAERKLRREGTRESIKEAGEIAEQIEKIKTILKTSWQQSSRSIPK